MHPVIWKDHDDSWTWSIEEGKAFEDGHHVLARDDAFPTRGDAKASMQKVWDRLIGEGKTPGRPGASTTTPLIALKQSGPGSRKNERPPSVVTGSQLEWAVVTGHKIIAVFSTQSQAKKFGREHHKGKYRLTRVNCTITE